MKAIGLYPRGEELLPEGNGWLLVEFGGGSQRGIRREGAPLDRRSSARQRRGLRGSTTTRSARSRSGECASPALGATAHVPGKPLTWEGWEDSAVAPEKLGGYLRDLRKLFEKYGYRGGPLRPLRPGLRPHAASTSTWSRRKASAGFGPSSTRRPTSSSPTAARSRASTATGRRGRSCCRRCSGRS